MKSRWIFAVVSIFALGPAIISRAAYTDALIPSIPHVRQRPDFCGEACVEMMLRKLGKKGDQNYVFNMSGLDPALGRGCYSADLARAAHRVGFKTGDVFYTIDAANAEAIEEQWKLLHADLVR